MRLVVATRNPGKLAELKRHLRDLPLELIDLHDLPDAPEVEETGETYSENALLKARALAEWAHLAALADDSGLEVDALGGAPGIRSARFAGPRATDEENRVHLLERMQGVPAERRRARFRCVIAVAFPEEKPIIVEGVCEGLITSAPRGEGGFGYDPLFFFPPADRTFAEISAAEKNRVSHRAMACREIRKELPRVIANCGSRISD